VKDGPTRTWLRMVSAAVLGVLTHLMLFWSYSLGLHKGVTAVILTVCYFGALGFACWPWRSYGTAVRVGLVASIGYTGTGAVGTLSAYLNGLLTRPSAVLAAVFTVFVVVSLVTCGILAAMVYVHRRYWPIYPLGHCAKCGYDLYGLSEPRCPECGAAFGPERRAGEPDESE
jgi:hypothetical protein